MPRAFLDDFVAKRKRGRSAHQGPVRLAPTAARDHDAPIPIVVPELDLMRTLPPTSPLGIHPRVNARRQPRRLRNEFSRNDSTEGSAVLWLLVLLAGLLVAPPSPAAGPASPRNRSTPVAPRIPSPHHAGHGARAGTHEAPEPFAQQLPAELLERPVALEDGLGRAGIPQGLGPAVAEPQAEAYLRQGLAHFHAYRWIEAARSFHEAARRAPATALPHVGLARVHDVLRDHAGARRHLARARERAQPADQAHVDAVAARIAATSAPPEQMAAAQARYRAELDRLLAAHPDDVELLLLRGQVEEPGPWGKGQSGGESGLEFYRRALALAPDHPGVPHYLAHTLENLGHHEAAERHAARLAALAPRSPHARHMHAHLLPRLGQWDAAIAEFEAAENLEREWYQREGMSPADDWHHVHNLTLLGVAHLRAGRPAVAERYLRRAFATPIPDPLARSWHTAYPEFLLVRGQPAAARAAAEELASRGDPLSAVAGGAVAAEAMLVSEGPAAARARLDSARRAADQLGRASADEPMRDAIRAVADDHLIFAEARVAQAADEPGAAARVNELAQMLRDNPTFDGWSTGWLRLQRLGVEPTEPGPPAMAPREQVR